MKIEAITKYKFNGKEYDSLKAVKDAVENRIGEDVLDPILRKIDLRHKDVLLLHELLCKPEIRKVLTECLNVIYEDQGDWNDHQQEYDTETKNILDYK